MIVITRIVNRAVALELQ